MAWIESHQSLLNHPKTRKLSRTLGIQRVYVIGHLHCLWWWCMEYADDGLLGRFDNDVIADACEWLGDPDEFVNALCEAGFLDRLGPGYAVHDWDDYAGKLIQKRRANTERMRVARAANNEPPSNKEESRATHVQRTNVAHTHTCEATVPNLTVPNQTEPEKPPRAHARTAAAPAGDVELSPEEREVVGIVQQVPGLSGIPPSEVALHLREALSCRDGPPLTFRTLKAEALKFRDFWTDKRGTAATGKWRGWQNAITNWFTRAKELPTFEMAAQNGQADEHITATERVARERAEYGRALAAAGIIPDPERPSGGTVAQRAAG